MEQYFPYYIAALIVFVVGYTFFLIWRNNQKIKAFLAKHPDAARVKPQHVEWLIYRKSVQIQAVDRQTPIYFFCGLFSQGVYLSPGEYDLLVSFTKSRAGILYKRVTTTYDDVTIRITAEPNKQYRLRFDTASEQYLFEEA